MESKIVSMNEIRELTGFSRPVWELGDIHLESNKVAVNGCISPINDSGGIDE